MPHTLPVSEFAAVVNPTAGGGRAVRAWAEIVRRLPVLRQARLVQGTAPELVREELAAALERGVERVLVLGGDGSMHLVSNIVLELGRGGDVALGMIPLGTGSDLPRSLGLPADPLACAERVVTARPRVIDALEVRTADGRCRYVVNVASAGISGLVDEAVSRMVRRGPTAYLRATLSAFFRYRPVPCRVRVDGQPWFEGEILLLAAANGTSFGRGMRIAPRACLDDGEIDVVLVKAVPRWQLPFRLGSIYRGSHLETVFVLWRRGREVEIEPLGPLPPFDLDGEVFPSSSAVIRVLPGALRILA